MFRRLILYSATAVALTAIIANHLGVFDRPDFAFYENLWCPDGLEHQCAHKEGVPAPPLYAIMAVTATKDIGSVIRRLLKETKEPLDAETESRLALAQAAKEYGAPEGAESLSIGLFFDDPNVVNQPRWAIGWVLSVSSYADLEVWREKVAATLQGSGVQVRAVRVGPGPVLKARIPWRNMFTPMIAPMFHWKRGFKTYEKGQKDGLYSANNKRNITSDEDNIACEIYVCGKGESMVFIDYVVLMGDTSYVWEDSFPSMKEAQNDVIEQLEVKSA